MEAPLGTRRLLDESACTKLCERVTDLQRGEPRDALPAHRHDDLAAFCGVSYIATELVVQLTHADLALQSWRMWRHGHELRRYMRRRQGSR